MTRQFVAHSLRGSVLSWVYIGAATQAGSKEIVSFASHCARVRCKERQGGGELKPAKPVSSQAVDVVVLVLPA